MKEALKLALEALETSPMSRKNKDAIDALREALAEQPAQRKPLTDAEIDGCWNKDLWKNQQPHRIFARAIEAAHGIKENT